MKLPRILSRLLEKTPVMLSAAKHLLYLLENEQSRSFAEFTLSPFASLRAVRERRANGLRMTLRKGFFSSLLRESARRIQRPAILRGLAFGCSNSICYHFGAGFLLKKIGRNRNSISCEASFMGKGRRKMAEMQNELSARQSILSRLADARVRTDQLFEMVTPEALSDRPIPERHRIVFYLGHLEAFDWNLLGRYAFDLKPFNAAFDNLFAFGIDPVDGGLPSDQPSDWPPVPEIHQYNQRLRTELDRHLESESYGDADDPLSPTGVYLNVAIEHRLMHAETLAYMLHQLPLERKVPKPAPRIAAAPRAERKMIEIPAGTATLGLLKQGGAFGWDNEFDAHSTEVPAFAIDEYKVTNGEFLKFVREGGYQDPMLWSKEDWEWVQQEGIRQPKFWIPRGDDWFNRSMFAEVPLPLDWPVYVSHAEAAAYARWAGKQLPTEEQFHRAAYGTPQGTERPYPWGVEPPAESYGTFDFARWDPSPVHAHPAGRSAFGVADLIGNGWEWTSSIFKPFPGFEPFPFYQGYSANFFDGLHYVMKGGSARTAASMLRRSFRNWFQPHYQYVYSGFRLVHN